MEPSTRYDIREIIMKTTKKEVKSYTVFMEWECCGNIWQLFLSPKTYNRKKYQNLSPFAIK